MPLGKCMNLLIHTPAILQSAGAVEYTDCIFAQGYPPPSKSPDYDIKQSDGEAPIMMELWECRVPFYCHHSQVHFGPEW